MIAPLNGVKRIIWSSGSTVAQRISIIWHSCAGAITRWCMSEGWFSAEAAPVDSEHAERPPSRPNPVRPTPARAMDLSSTCVEFAHVGVSLQEKATRRVDHPRLDAVDLPAVVVREEWHEGQIGQGAKSVDGRSFGLAGPEIGGIAGLLAAHLHASAIEKAALRHTGSVIAEHRHQLAASIQANIVPWKTPHAGSSPNVPHVLAKVYRL